jgi:hypothetical protein
MRRFVEKPLRLTVFRAFQKSHFVGIESDVILLT